MTSAISRIDTSCGLPMFTGSLVCGRHQLQDAGHQVADELKAARLRTVAEDGHVLVAQRLRHERGHGAAVVERMRGPYVLKMRTMRVSSP
jgi:hypothetical protein